MLKNPIIKAEGDKGSPSRDDSNEKHKPHPDFFTKLSVAVDKIYAYKDYFYDKGAKEFYWKDDKMRAIPTSSKDSIKLSPS